MSWKLPSEVAADQAAAASTVAAKPMDATAIAGLRSQAATMDPNLHLTTFVQRVADQQEAALPKTGNAGTAAAKSNPIPAPVLDPGTAALPTTTAGTATVTDTQPAPADVPADPWNVGDTARKRSTIGSMGAGGGTLGSTKQPLG